MRQLHRHEIPVFLDDTHVARLRGFLGTGLTDVLAHQIAVVTGLTLAQSLQTLQALAESTHLPRFLAIYHGCQPEGEYILTGTRSYGTGFPELPFTCPNCGEDVTSLDRLRFDVLLRLDEPVLIMPDNARDHH